MATDLKAVGKSDQAFRGIKKRRKGLARLLQHSTFRRVTQIGFAAFITFTVVQHTLVGEGGESTTASAEAFCPFGGLETLYKYVSSGGNYVPHTHLSNVVLAGAVLLVALLARNAFCGWICPLGFLQDMVSKVSTWVQKRFRPVRRAVKVLKTRGAWLSVLDRPLRLLKYGVLVWAVGGAAALGVMVFRDYDPWAALLTIAEWSIGPGLFVLGVTLVASLFVERPWCRYACPLGAASGLVSKLSPVYLQRNVDACKACGVCNKACPMGLKVDTASTITSVDCIGCLECVGACPRDGALELKVGLPPLRVGGRSMQTVAGATVALAEGAAE
jgi:polyferredoxin